MPSQMHEALLLLFRNRPTLAPELLRDALGIDMPAYTEARIDSADLTDIQPAEYRADLVVLLIEHAPVHAVIVEMQLSPDPRKPFVWPSYVTNLRSRLELEVCLLVVTPTRQPPAGRPSRFISVAVTGSRRSYSAHPACPRSLTKQRREPIPSLPCFPRWRMGGTPTVA